jgi:glucose-6-phosphate 1-epimerase
MDRVILVDSSSGARAEVYLFGATITSFQDASGHERLFVSSKAVLDGSKAIRGGIPVVFPQFGQPNAEMAQHGFARNSLWTLQADAVVATDDKISVVLTLQESEATLKVWPHRFRLDYTVTLTKTALVCSLAATNTGDAGAWACHTLLHTYLAVPAIADVRVGGFQQRAFQNKLRGGAVEVEGAGLAVVDQEVDKVFVGTLDNAPMSRLELFASGGGSSGGGSGDDDVPTVTVDVVATLGHHAVKHDVVFWNAWVEKAKALADMGDEDYLVYVCIEPGTVSDFTSVAAGQTLTLTQTLTVRGDTM